MSGDALLAAIYAAPDDLAARAIYADWLLDRGDPRGELMQLQLREPKTKDQAARELELVEKHAEAWIGRLTELTTWIEFEHGFLARCGITKAPSWAIGLREWATVKHIGIADDWNRDLAKLVIHPAMKSLESLRVSDRSLGFMLSAWERSRVRKLAIDGNVDAKLWAALVKQPMFAELTDLEIHGSVADPIRIGEARYQSVAVWLDVWQLEWRRGDDGKLSSLRVQVRKLRRGRTPDKTQLLKFFAALPADSLGAIELVNASHYLGMRDVKTALRRQPRIVDDL